MFYEIYRHEHEGEAPRASFHVYCIKHEDFSCYNYVFISRRPLTYRVIIIIIINRKELYDFYYMHVCTMYMAITLTMGYRYNKRYSVHAHSTTGPPNVSGVLKHRRQFTTWHSLIRMSALCDISDAVQDTLRHQWQVKAQLNEFCTD